MQRHRPPTFRINRRAPLANGLVFAGLGGGASTLKYVDASGYSNHGTLTNMDPATDWVFDAELRRWVLDFDGNDDGVDTDTVASEFWKWNPRTISTWCKRHDARNAMLLGAFHYGDYDFEKRYGVGLLTDASGNGHVVWSYGSQDIYNNVSSPIPLSAWTHVLTTVTGIGSGQYIRLHVGGVLVSEYLGTTAMSSSNDGYMKLSIGGRVNVNGLENLARRICILGSIADPLIYNRILSPTEIQQLADPSNVMLSSLILPPARRLWPVATTGEESNLIIPHHGMMAM